MKHRREKRSRTAEKSVLRPPHASPVKRPPSQATAGEMPRASQAGQGIPCRSRLILAALTEMPKVRLKFLTTGPGLQR